MVRTLFWIGLVVIILLLIILTEVPETVAEQAQVLEITSPAEIMGHSTEEYLVYIYSPA